MSNTLPTVSVLRSILLIFVCIALLSCVPRPRVVLSLDEIEPFEGPVSEEILRNSVVLKNLQTLRSELKVTVKKGRKKLGSYKGALIFRRPDSLRVRLYGALGATGMDAAHLKNALTIYLPQEKVLYEGRSPAAHEGLTYRLKGYDEEYVLFVFGSTDDSEGLNASYVFDRRTLLNKEVNYYSNGERLLSMHFARYSDGVPLLADIDFSNGYSMRAELIEPEKDVEIPERLFDPVVGHEGVKVLPLEELMDAAK